MRALLARPFMGTDLRVASALATLLLGFALWALVFLLLAAVAS